jgi:molybdopterin/thiamine biosynthesis adenylyltransferase
MRLRTRAPRLRVTAARLKVDADNLGPLLAELPPGHDRARVHRRTRPQVPGPGRLPRARLPLVVGGAQRWRGQAQAVVRGQACLRCVFEEPPPPTCRSRAARSG